MAVTSICELKQRASWVFEDFCFELIWASYIECPVIN